MDKETRHPNMILKAGGLKGAATVHVFSRGKQSHLPPRDDEEQGGGPVGWGRGREGKKMLSLSLLFFSQLFSSSLGTSLGEENGAEVKIGESLGIERSSACLCSD
ncbi:hypothetical protein CEXT_275941 [Caerostris extrusa]|uniref:Uncharacterized protein n=1 Tax=Caerostris extrusa TaxID=172846 RepID=A0AAV4P9T5_CAEEX|nr:hypothetical protein CEXT_275941 [Caerostris extrusa]